MVDVSLWFGYVGFQDFFFEPYNRRCHVCTCLIYIYTHIQIIRLSTCIYVCIYIYPSTPSISIYYICTYTDTSYIHLSFLLYEKCIWMKLHVHTKLVVHPDHVYLCIYTHLSLSLSLPISISISISIHLFVCQCVYLHLCKCVVIRMKVYISTCIHAPNLRDVMVCHSLRRLQALPATFSGMRSLRTSLQ